MRISLIWLDLQAKLEVASEKMFSETMILKQWIILVLVIGGRDSVFPLEGKYIPGIYAVHTANWVIICHLPPFTRS